ncbi:MAG TPA: glycosyltransferase [Saccharofermentans sp.]|nr:glycosyltransferase [Saccharofermentans sp.]
MRICLAFLCDDKFKPGLECLFKSLAKHDPSTFALDKIVFTDSDIVTSIFGKVASCRKIDASQYAKIPVKNPRFAKAYMKFEMFDLLRDYDRVVFIDSDCLVLDCLPLLTSEELNGQSIWMAKDDGMGLSKKFEGKHYRMNSGVVVANSVKLDLTIKKDLIDIANSGKSYDGGDQGVLNIYLNQKIDLMKYLPMEYNCLKRIYSHHKNIWSKIKPRLLHFVGLNPWDAKQEPEYEELNNLWRKTYEG